MLMESKRETLIQLQGDESQQQAECIIDSKTKV